MSLKFGPMRPRFYPVGDKQLPSVTTICGLLGKPALKKWSANMAVEYIKSHLPFGYHAEEHRFDKAKKAFIRESMEAADYGTFIHTLCEMYLRTGLFTTTPHEQTNKMLLNFAVWCKKHNVEVVVLEEKIIGDGYAGRTDLICWIDSFWDKKSQKKRVLAVLDIKTSKAYYPEMGLQVAAYRAGYSVSLIARAMQEYKENILSKIPTHCGIIRIDKKSCRVNFKDYSADYEQNLRGFLLLKDFFYNQNNWEGK